MTFIKDQFIFINLHKYCYLMLTLIYAIIAKLSPNFSFSWAELVFNLNFAPPTHGKYQYGQSRP